MKNSKFKQERFWLEENELNKILFIQNVPNKKDDERPNQFESKKIILEQEGLKEWKIKINQR